MLMKLGEWDDAIYYRIGCDCLCREHDLEIWAEVDEHGCKTINMSGTLHSYLWQERFDHKWLRWLNGPVNRIAIALTVLFTGRVEMTGDFILGKDNITALRTALDEIEAKFP